jgi:hypothetical protein
MRNKIVWIMPLLAMVVLMLALFWPEPKKPGEISKYYRQPIEQLKSIEYDGEMALGTKQKVQAHYVIIPERNRLKPAEFIHRIEIRDVSTTDTSLALRAQKLKEVKTFYASPLVNSIVQDWSAPDFYFKFDHEISRDEEYGIAGCKNNLKIEFKSETRRFCIGKSTHGDTRRYLLDVEKNLVIITPDFTVRRLLNNIFAQREQSLHPFGQEKIDTINVKIDNAVLAALPQLKKETGGNLNFRMRIKDDEKKKINVWYVEKHLTIKPSHAAEFAGFLAALRVNAPFALPAIGAEAPLEMARKSADIAQVHQPALKGQIRVAKIDAQDEKITDFQFYELRIRSDT